MSRNISSCLKRLLENSFCARTRKFKSSNSTIPSALSIRKKRYRIRFLWIIKFCSFTFDFTETSTSFQLSLNNITEHGLSKNHASSCVTIMNLTSYRCLTLSRSKFLSLFVRVIYLCNSSVRSSFKFHST
jgi:hypothetical protein